MNTNKLKRFAQAARKKLIEQVGAKLEYVLHADTAELREKASQVRTAKEELAKSSKDLLVEKIAYTWFNRLVALRFMDVNDYQPLDIRVISPKEGYTFPELLDEAKQGHLPKDLNVNAKRVYNLLDGRVPSNNPQNEAYKMLLIAACNHLHTVLPFLFERINDYTELLLPDDLTSEFSIVHDVREGMEAEDCQQVEIIGWLYQFYISEKKDEVFASKAKVKKEDIPAATQLFTPRWIVEYMVQNTVGKLWLQNKPSSRLREHMPYFIESASLQSEDYLKINSPEEITLLDQACGSGHILVYGFELLSKIYEEEGYNASEIPKLIIQHNLFGFEIDERAAQLAAMALMMKARSYQRRFFRKGEVPQPHILCFQDLTLDEKETVTALAGIGTTPSAELLHDFKNMRQATNLGSLIIPHAELPEIENMLRKIDTQTDRVDMYQQHDMLHLKATLDQLHLMGQKYTCIVDNPPYMGGRNMNSSLSTFVKKNYPTTKTDLMACFIDSGLAMLRPKGFLGMINQHSWMFLSSYEELRKGLVENIFIDTLLHLGPRTFPEIGGEVVQNVSFVLFNQNLNNEGVYVRLVDFESSEQKKVKTIEAKNNSGQCPWINQVNQRIFEKIPGSPLGYWMSEDFINLFENSNSLSEFIVPSNGIQTGNNEKYTRHWWTTGIAKKDIKWFPYSKGGAFRKWYGNIELFINWENYGIGIATEKNSCLRGKNFYFNEGLTWSDISTGKLAFRLLPKGSLFDAKGPAAFGETYFSMIGYLNTPFVNKVSEVLNPTLSFQIGELKKIPINENLLNNDELVLNCINISRQDWDCRETSWDFNYNELLRIKNGEELQIEEIYDLYQRYWENKFLQLYHNEVNLNNQVISFLGLQNELTPDVPLEDITILQQETSIENGELVFHADEVMAQFVSYAVGCMFGRYSLDKPGLILANQDETLQDYFHKLEKQEQDISFLPDADNIIPILDDAWFEDDIVSRFHTFLKVTFGEANFAKNLAFVEECLGKDMRKYFVKDFYTDHVRRYKKRPIYWLFSSPKGSFNVLIYMHRYTPDTVNNILNKYLREYQEKLRTHREHLERVEVSGSPSEKTKAIKERARIDQVLLELQEYERKILYPLATERLPIDLDNGVLVNYNLFGKAVKLVPGLNDPKTKKKVAEFDWVKMPEVV